MNETLKSLHDRFYTPLPLAEYEQEVETCHHQLIERLEKPERKLVLDHRYPEPYHRRTVPGQLSLRAPPRVGTGRRNASFRRKQASIISRGG